VTWIGLKSVDLYLGVEGNQDSPAWSGSQDEGRNGLCFVVATINEVEPLKKPSVTSFKRYACSLFFHFQNVVMVVL
jgi:hypothetical protein